MNEVRQSKRPRTLKCNSKFFMKVVKPKWNSQETFCMDDVIKKLQFMFRKLIVYMCSNLRMIDNTFALTSFGNQMCYGEFETHG